MNETGGHYAQQIKPDREGHILYSINLYVQSKRIKSDSWKQRIEWYLPGAEEWRKWKDIG